MNYEELLEAKNNGRLSPARQPIGEYYRIKVDGKYRGLVDIRQEMNDNIVFCEAIKAECERNKTLVNPHQLHFTPVMLRTVCSFLLMAIWRMQSALCSSKSDISHWPFTFSI